MASSQTSVRDLLMFETGQADERARIVAMLRALPEDERGVIEWLANKIERGDHQAPLKESEDT